jgi:hypothetical protein
MYIQLPLDILRYILLFFEEWRIIGDKFVHIAKLLQIARPVFFQTNMVSAVELIFRKNPDKCYQLHYMAFTKKFTVFLYYQYTNPEMYNTSPIVTTYFTSINRWNWVQRKNKDLLIWL